MHPVHLVDPVRSVVRHVGVGRYLQHLAAVQGLITFGLLGIKPQRHKRQANYLISQSGFRTLNNDASERSIVHRLAMYLQKLFPDYHVDCEYNLKFYNSHFRKQIHEIAPLFPLPRTAIYLSIYPATCLLGVRRFCLFGPCL